MLKQIKLKKDLWCERGQRGAVHWIEFFPYINVFLCSVNVCVSPYQPSIVFLTFAFINSRLQFAIFWQKLKIIYSYQEGLIKMAGKFLYHVKCKQ